MSLIIKKEGIEEYTPWCGAVNPFNYLRDHNKLEALEQELEMLHPEGVSEMYLNDLLWHETDYVFGLINLPPYATCIAEDEEDA